MPGTALPAVALPSGIVRTEKHLKNVVKAVKNLEADRRDYSADTLLVFVRVDFLADSVTPAALTMLVEDVCTIVDLLALPKGGLTPLLSYMCDSTRVRLVVESAGVVGCLYGGVECDGVPMTFDVQLGHEVLHGGFAKSLSETASVLGVALNKGVTNVPLVTTKKDVVKPFVDVVLNLRNVFEKLEDALDQHACLQWLQLSTDRVRICSRVEDGTPWNVQLAVGFRESDACMASLGVLEELGGGVDTTVSCDGEAEELHRLCRLLPHEWADRLQNEAERQLIDVEVDLGRAPFAFFQSGPKLILSEGREDVATEDVLESITEALEADGDEIGEDNRAGIRGTLHRVSVIRSYPSRRIVGVTLRASRHIYGVATILYDVLFSEEHARHSILLMGPPGSGKTTMSRDIARLLSEMNRVIIVDSSDEIGGPSAVTHRCIGDARRMSVPGGKHKLADTLVEAVENHTPQVIIADELSNQLEVNGAATARARGVRMVASAHGNLRSLVNNSALRNLVGGSERVIMSDRFSKGKDKDKLKTMRASEPIFDVIVEMGVVKGDPTACRVILNSSKAIDEIWRKNEYKCQIRRRNEVGQIVFMNTSA